MTKKTVATGDDVVLQWGTFRLGDELYGINVMQIREVLRYTEITPVPGAPYYVLGIINLRGNVVTVIDTRSRFGLPRGSVDNSSRIVVVEVDNQVIGMLVDSVAEVTYINKSDIEVAPNVGNDETSRFIQGVCNKNDELLILVELEKMLESKSSVADAIGF
jgi:purine-binding chemotaxis protein CheW